MNAVASILPRASESTVLSVDNLSKSYRKKKALDDISFSIPAASLTVILGPAGAGKTTTLRLIAGLENPDSGTITLAGKNAIPLQPKDRDIAMIFDNIALYPNKTGFDNIASPLLIRKEGAEEIERQVSEIAHTLKLSHVLNRLPKTMSGGERQRVALGRALIRSPRLFLLDEPLSSLDAKLRTELRTELRRLQQELGYTFLLATPDFQEALAIADTVIVLREGKIVQTASPQGLYDHPIDRDVALFIGAPQINILQAQQIRSTDGKMMAFADSLLPLPRQIEDCLPREQLEFELGIRPENLRLCSPDAAEIKGLVSDIEPLGLKAVLSVKNDVEEIRLVVNIADIANLSMEENVGLSIINRENLLAFDSNSGLRFG